jgi:hypothetical protein
MKQFKKTIEVSPTDELVNNNCGSQSVGSCPSLVCVCRNGGIGNDSIEDEDEIIF